MQSMKLKIIIHLVPMSGLILMKKGGCYILNGKMHVLRQLITNRLRNTQQAIRWLILVVVVESIAAALHANTRNRPSAYLGKNRVLRGGVEKELLIVDIEMILISIICIREISYS